jgi:putative heme-binding domain-containing protein
MRIVPMLLAAASAFGQTGAALNPRTTPADVAEGAKAFRSHCAPCHGPRGEGGRGPNLAAGVFFHGTTDSDLYRNISEGVAGTAMPSLFFPPESVWQLVSFVRSLGQAKAQTRPTGDPGHGGQLFRDKQCLTCHLVRGEGGFRGPELSVIGSQRSADFLRHAITDPNAETDPDYRVANVVLENGSTYAGFIMNEDTYAVEFLDFSKGLLSLPKHNFRKFDIDKAPLMPSYKDQLTETELNDLVAYLWSLKRSGRSE